ncbi:heavy metal-associated isoprenylated plant protein 43 [Triticum aestivum]|uniref:heavy metal-associated isoprenylated plant protein 43 n=1 Tax=Triticum aestivum TaxID=4565 RepID=UPI001D024AD0|nr:heavy metal-associated isoprenylated plant protein 43-like [Triticum aestivum]
MLVFSHLNDLQKMVIRADLIGDKCKSKIMSIVAKLEGIKSMDIDQDKCTLTVVGTVDPVCVVHKLRKSCFAATIISVDDDKPKEKKSPCQEACEKAWKDKYDKACQEKCEKDCKEPCCDDCDNGTPSCGYEYRCTPGCYSSPCGLPSCHYYSNGYGYGYGVRAPPLPPLGYACYEERSRGGGGECGIQ